MLAIFHDEDVLRNCESEKYPTSEEQDVVRDALEKICTICWKYSFTFENSLHRRNLIGKWVLIDPLLAPLLYP